MILRKTDDRFTRDSRGDTYSRRAPRRLCYLLVPIYGAAALLRLARAALAEGFSGSSFNMVS